MIFFVCDSLYLISFWGKFSKNMWERGKNNGKEGEGLWRQYEN
jgi:hypothetical protein